MKTKKLLALLMAGAMSVSMLSGCGGSAAKTDDSNADAADASASAESDMDYVKSNGRSLVIGITDFAPMDYKEDGSDEWVGFDADMAKAFAESLGVKARVRYKSTGTTRSWSWIPRALTLFGTA